MGGERMDRMGRASRDDQGLAARVGAGSGRVVAAIASAALLAACSESGSMPTPQPTPVDDSWFTFVVQCTGCPGLTNAEIDRTASPHSARLRVGQQTSLRAASRDGCEALQNMLQ